MLEVGGEGVLGSDETVTVLPLGVATAVSRRTLLNFTVGVGLTSDSPDFQLGLSVPVRFQERHGALTPCPAPRSPAPAA